MYIIIACKGNKKTWKSKKSVLFAFPFEKFYIVFYVSTENNKPNKCRHNSPLGAICASRE